MKPNLKYQQGSSGYSSNQMIKQNSVVSQANMSRLLKQMSLIVSTELQQIAIDLYEKMDETGGDKPVKYIKLKEEFRQHVHSSMLAASIPLSQSSPQFKSNMTSSPQQPTSSAPSLPTATKQQLNALIQMNSLAASFKKVDLTPTNKTGKPTVAQIFNPKKDLEQFFAKEKNVNSNEMSAFRSTASTSSFFYSTDSC